MSGSSQQYTDLLPKDRQVAEKQFLQQKQIAVCFLWLLLPGDYRVTDEVLLAEPT